MDKKQFEDYVKRIGKEKDLHVLIDSYDEFERNFSCKPDRKEYPYPKAGTVIDENKSVKWNREEVVRLRESFENKVKELNTYKNLIRDAYAEKIVVLSVKKRDISRNEGRKIWEYAYSKEHDKGIYAITRTFEDVVDLYEGLLKIQKSEEKNAKSHQEKSCS